MEFLASMVEVSRQDLIIEPSAGSGVFIPFIRQLTPNGLFLDTHPEHPDIVRMDFLSLERPLSQGRIHVVGNPPFGRQSSMAVRFIRHAAGFADTIALILPRSFRKPSMQARIPSIFHMVGEMALPQDSFTIDGSAHHVPCVFQVWVRMDLPRALPEIVKEPIGFRFVKRGDEPHVAIRRVGFYAGRVSRDTQDKSEQSHYFVRFDSDLISSVDFEVMMIPGKDDTVGPRSISKAEVIDAINNAIKMN